MNWWKNIKRSDWMVIGFYWVISIAITYYDNISPDLNIYSPELVAYYFKPFGNNQYIGMFFILFIDSIIDTIAVILIVFWAFNNFIVKKKYILGMSAILFILIVTSIVQPLLLPVVYPTLSNNLLPSIISGVSDQAGAIGIFVVLLIGKQFYDTQNQLIRLEKEKKENELKMLKAQIDPHFLFNNLNILDILINTDPAKASAYNKRLSSLYRYMIRHKDEDVVSLEEEWKFSEDYIYLLQQRFDDLFLFEKKLDAGNLKNYFIPPASMQTLLENIVKHNIALPDQPIRISIFLENDFLCAKNDRRQKEQVKDSTGTGLDNLKTRIELLTDRFLIVEKTDSHFIVKVPLVKVINK